MAESKDNANVKYAVKILHVKKMSDTLREQVREELKVLCDLDHSYVVQYIESFEDEKYLYIVMEYI